MGANLDASILRKDEVSSLHETRRLNKRSKVSYWRPLDIWGVQANCP